MWKTPLALARLTVVPVLALVLASCGGGSTAGPVTTASAPPGRTQSSAVPPATTAQPAAPPATDAPRAPDAEPPRPSSGRSRPSGGAEPPSAADDSSAAAADEPATAAPQDTTPPPPAADAPDPPPASTALDERAKLILTRRVSPSHYFQQGTVVGTYDGTMEVEARITSRGVLVSFTATLPGGTIFGRGVAVAILDSTTWPALRGTAMVTGGTGRFAGIHGRRLKLIGRAKPDASRARVRLAGTVRLG